MRGASAFIAADHLNRFSNSSPSVIRVARDSDTFFGQTLLCVTRGVSPCRKLGLAKCNATKVSLEII